MLNEALKYIEQGWHVVGLKYQSKLPLSAETTYKNAASDKDTVVGWFDKWPKMNIGIQPARSGLLVLDVDPKSGGMNSLDELEKKHGKIETRSVTTGSGGLHYYFLSPSFSTPNRIGVMPGLDIISSQNHVVAPPSVHASGGLYRWNDETAPLLPVPDWLYKLLPSVEVRPKVTMPISGGVRGELAQLTKEFMAGGAPAGTWNNRLFKAAKDYQEQGYSHEEFLEAAENITGHLDYKDLSTIESAFKDEPKYAPRVEPNRILKETIMRCHLITDMSDVENKIFVNLQTGQSFPGVSYKNLSTLFTKNERASYLDNQSIIAKVEYNPRVRSLLTTDPETGFHVYNTYQPPAWLAESFYHGKTLEPVKEIPAVYDEFLTHLTDNHIESKEYVLDWLANSLRARNFTILTAIGKEGVGKGVFAEIMRGVHGKSNYDLVTDNIFKERFNGKLENKTLLFVDEIALKDKQSHDRIKAVVNDSMDIERKGKDSKTIVNYASFYIASNHLDAIDIGSNDRRYSIIQLTDIKMATTDWIPRINAELLNENNINALARYLVGRQVTRNMMVPFRSPRFEAVRGATLLNWQEYLIDVFFPTYKGKTISFEFLQEEVRKNTEMFHPPGRRKLEMLQEKYPEVFRVVHDPNNRGKRMVQILP